MGRKGWARSSRQKGTSPKGPGTWPKAPASEAALPPIFSPQAQPIFCESKICLYLCALKKAAKVFWCNGVRENRTE